MTNRADLPAHIPNRCTIGFCVHKSKPLVSVAGQGRVRAGEHRHGFVGSSDIDRMTRYDQQIQIIAEIRNPNVMELETLKDLYIHELKDLYSAEKQLTKALPKMAKAATSDRLADGFRMHLDQTEEHVNRLEKILESQNASTRGPKCKGMEGLIEEGEEMIEEDAEDEVRDAGLISAAQRVEHYEIAGYGCARTYAELLGDSEGARLLQQTLDEEGATNKKLTELAKTLINVRAQAV